MRLMKVTLGICALVTCGSVLGAGCAATTDDAQEGADGAMSQAAPEPETLTMTMDNAVARSTKLSPTAARVDIYDRTGVLQFSVDYRTGGDQDQTIRWTLYPESTGKEASSAPVVGGFQQPMADLPTLEDAIKGAVYVQTQVARAQQGKEYDNYGCDLPSWVWFGDSCGSNGKCCDVHDACYAKNGCTASSWYWTTPGGACDKCNGAVVYCISFTNPGPSSCCAAHNCGKPR